MKRTASTRILAPIVLALAVIAAGCLPPPDDSAAPGGGLSASHAGKVVDLTLQGLEGRRLDLASVRGKVVLVDCFATWCPPCRRVLPGLARLSREKSSDLVVVGLLSGDEPRNLSRLMESQQIPYFVGLEDRSTRQVFSPAALPTVYILDRAGRLVDAVIGGVPEAELLARASRHF